MSNRMSKIYDIIADLFQEKRIRFAEDENFMLSLMCKLPYIGTKFDDSCFGKNNEKAKIKYGVFVSIGRLLFAFARKFLYLLVFGYLPLRLIGRLTPGILGEQAKAVMYFFVIMTSLCGSLTNCTLFSMTDRDYMLLKVLQVKIKFYYIERIISKMIIDFICFSPLLMIFGVKAGYAFAAGLVTAAMRPIGELIDLLIHDHLTKVYSKKGTINGIIMAAAFIAAYCIPASDNGSIPDIEKLIVNPVFIIVEIIISAATIYFMFRYDRFEQIKKDAICLRRKEN